MEKKFFALKLLPPRASFSQDMNEQERAIMQKHVQYWMDLMKQGKVVAFGPVLDPAGAYGLGIVCANDETEVKSITDNDPATGLNRYEFHRMLAVVPPGLLPT
jgi:uncharacterized protein YciI